MILGCFQAAAAAAEIPGEPAVKAPAGPNFMRAAEGSWFV